MNEEYNILLHDLLILEEMADNMRQYLISNATNWVIPRANMPKLTIGGYLMRQHRLLVIKDHLESEDRARLWGAIQKFDEALVEQVVRFETRAHEELHTRIGEWVNFLRDLGSRMVSEVNFYVGIVDTRVVITGLIDQLQKQPYHLEQGVLEEIKTLDNHLRDYLEDNEFIWDEIWKPAYPQEKYWCLYGCPRRTRATTSK